VDHGGEADDDGPHAPRRRAGMGRRARGRRTRSGRPGCARSCRIN
jgi:hypothetical protein